MIPDIAVIVSTYAVARLLCEYILVGEKAQGPRVVVAIIAIVVIGVFLASVLSNASSIPSLGI